MTASINHIVSVGKTLPLKKAAAGETQVFRAGFHWKNETDKMMHYSKSGQDISMSSYKKILKDLEKQIKECKRENYDSQEEFEKAYDYLQKKYEAVQTKMKELDNGYTTTNADAVSRKLSAIGKFFKDCCDGIKTVGTDFINGIIGFFGFKKAV